MARSDFVNQLAKKSPAYKAGILLGCFAVLGLLYYQFSYSDMLDERDRLDARKVELINAQTKLNKDLADKKRLAEQNEILQRTIRDNQKALPTEAELPSFFDHLQRKAGDAGVNIRRWDRREERDVDIYIRVPVEVEITGNFYNLMRYFSLLGANTRGAAVSAGRAEERLDERIVSIEGLSLGDAKLKDGDVILAARFTASTFRQQAPPPSAGGKQGGQVNQNRSSKSRSKSRSGAKSAPAAR